MKKLLFPVCVVALFSLGAAEVCMELNKPADWKNPKIVKAGSDCLTVPSVQQISAKTFAVNKGKTYTISGEFRSTDASKTGARLLIGFSPLTADGKVISATSVMMANTQLGELAEAAAPGAKQIKVKNVSAWKINSAIFQVAFNAKADFSDLPNFDLSPKLIHGALAVDANGVATLKFKTPLTKAYPAGTRIRLHRAGDYYLFVGLKTNPKKLTTEWQRFYGQVSGKGGPGIRVWYPGTAKAYAAILPLNAGRIEIRDLQVTEE